MLHFNELEYCKFTILVSNLQKYSVLLNFNLENLRVSGIEKRQLIIKVINLYLINILLSLDFDNIAPKELNNLLLSLQRIVILLFMLQLRETLDTMLLLLGAQVKNNLSLGVTVDGAHGQGVRLVVVGDRAYLDALSVFLVDALVDQDAVG